MSDFEKRIADFRPTPGAPSVGEVMIAGLKALGRSPEMPFARGYIQGIAELALAERDLAVAEAQTWPKDGPRDCFGNKLRD